MPISPENEGLIVALSWTQEGLMGDPEKKAVLMTRGLTALMIVNKLDFDPELPFADILQIFDEADPNGPKSYLIVRERNADHTAKVIVHILKGSMKFWPLHNAQPFDRNDISEGLEVEFDQQQNLLNAKPLEIETTKRSSGGPIYDESLTLDFSSLNPETVSALLPRYRRLFEILLLADESYNNPLYKQPNMTFVESTLITRAVVIPLPT